MGEIRSLGRRAFDVTADLASESDTEELADRAMQAAGRLDVLVNNASVFPENRWSEVAWADLEACLRVNAWAPFALARRFARIATSGHVVNILDTRVAGHDPLHAAYHASKVLLGALTRALAVELAPHVAVNAVAPGPILPPAGKDESYLESLAGALPLRRVGTPADVAAAVVYLVGTRFVTGQVIYVDGGRHVRESGGG